MDLRHPLSWIEPEETTKYTLSSLLEFWHAAVTHYHVRDGAGIALCDPETGKYLERKVRVCMFYHCGVVLGDKPHARHCPTRRVQAMEEFLRSQGLEEEFKQFKEVLFDKEDADAGIKRHSTQGVGAV